MLDKYVEVFKIQHTKLRQDIPIYDKHEHYNKQIILGEVHSLPCKRVLQHAILQQLQMPISHKLQSILLDLYQFSHRLGVHQALILQNMPKLGLHHRGLYSGTKALASHSGKIPNLLHQDLLQGHVIH